LARIRYQCFVYGVTDDNPSDTVKPEQLEANLQSVAEAAYEAISDEASGDSNEFSATISQTLKNLSENAENLQVSDRNIILMDFDLYYSELSQDLNEYLKETKRH
jgi:hypothetical protein